MVRLTGVLDGAMLRGTLGGPWCHERTFRLHPQRFIVLLVVVDKLSRFNVTLLCVNFLSNVITKKKNSLPRH